MRFGERAVSQNFLSFTFGSDAQKGTLGVAFFAEYRPAEQPYAHNAEVEQYCRTKERLILPRGDGRY